MGDARGGRYNCGDDAVVDGWVVTTTGQQDGKLNARWNAAMRQMIGQLVIFLAMGVLAGQAAGQSSDLPPGFQRISGRYIDVVTDMPLNDSLRELPKVFDAAIPQWCEAFGVPLTRVSSWHVEGFIIEAKERFVEADFLPSRFADFPYGYQWKNRLWVNQQATEYYRRHLLLHEGTHWFMWRLFGSNGPPWLMEGMAEWYGTHRWDGEQLEMGIVPSTKHEVPSWGRITIIKEQLEDGLAPSLETILRYDTTAHRHAEAYAWSWAVVLFLRNHPDSQDALAALMKQPMRDDMTQTRALFRRLNSNWPKLRTAWNATLSDLEYGFDTSRQLVKLSRQAQAVSTEATLVTVASDQTWQASGLSVRQGEQFEVQASGTYTLADAPGPWHCEPQGVTLEYFRGRPLGELQLAILSPIADEPGAAAFIEPITIGTGGIFQAAETGELFFRVNESSGGLHDNRGTLELQISK